MKLQLMLINVVNRFLGASNNVSTTTGNSSGASSTTGKFNSTTGNYSGAPEWVNKFLEPIFKILTSWLLPVLLILVGFAGTIYIIMLSIKYARAENADEKDQAKKNLINVVIAVVIMAVALLLIFLFINNVDLIFGWTRDPNKTT